MARVPAEAAVALLGLILALGSFIAMIGQVLPGAAVNSVSNFGIVLSILYCSLPCQMRKCSALGLLGPFQTDNYFMKNFYYFN